MTQLADTLQSVDSHLREVCVRDGFVRFEAPALVESLFPVGTGAIWVDLTFGASAWVEDIQRVRRERIAEEANRLALESLEAFAQYAAESGLFDHLTPEIPDEQFQTMEIREVPRELAKAEILDYVKKNPQRDAFETALALKLDPEVVFELCDELISEGKLEIGEAANAV